MMPFITSSTMPVNHALHPYVVNIVAEETDESGHTSVITWATLVYVDTQDERLNSRTFMHHLAKRDALTLFKTATTYGPNTKITVESVVFVDLW